MNPAEGAKGPLQKGITLSWHEPSIKKLQQLLHFKQVCLVMAATGGAGGQDPGEEQGSFDKKQFLLSAKEEQWDGDDAWQDEPWDQGWEGTHGWGAAKPTIVQLQRKKAENPTEG